jgi:allophanate hydrolase subunit 2
MISEATTFGTIQVPAGGQPIVLMADRQTTGGYPKIAYVATVDLPLLAQMGPGDKVQFEPLTLEAAQTLDTARTRAFIDLAQALQPVRTLLLNH